MSNRNAKGASIVEFAFVLPFLVFMLFAIIDGGRICLGYASVRTASSLGVTRAAAVDRPEWKNIRNLGIGKVSLDKLQNNSLFQSSSSEWYDAASGTQLDHLEVKAIAYANEIMKQNVGAVTFPCHGKANCVECFITRGDGSAHDLLFSSGGNSTLNRSKMLGLSCRYDVPLLTSALVGYPSAYVTVSSRAYTPVKGYNSPVL